MTLSPSSNPFNGPPALGFRLDRCRARWADYRIPTQSDCRYRYYTATIAVVLFSCPPRPLLHILAPSGFGVASLAEIATQLVIQGFLAGAVAIVLYTFAVHQLGPQPASLFMPCIPVTTAVIGMVVLGERPTPPQFAAIAVMTFGMVFPILQKR